VPLRIVILRQWRESSGFAAKLAGIAKYYFRLARIKLNLSINLDFTALQLANVAHMSKVSTEYHDRKRAIAITLAIIQEMRAAFGLDDFYDISADASRSANFGGRLFRRDAVGENLRGEQ